MEEQADHRQAMNSQSRPEKPVLRLSWKTLLPLLALLLGVLVYLGTAPQRQEHALRQASLRQLQDRAAHDPDNPRALYYFGLRLEQAGQTAPAAAVLEHATSLSESEDIYLAWAAAVPDTQAETILTAFLAQHPFSAAGHLALAQLYLRQNDQAHCYEEAFSAIHAGACTVAAWQLYGDIALETNHASEAEAAYRHAAALEPKSARDQIGLGSALMQLNRPAEGKACLSQAAALAPQDGATWAALGSILLQNTESGPDLETARRDLQKGLRLRPDLEAAYLDLGECSLREKRWPEAVAELTRAQAHLPDKPEVPFVLAQAYRGLGDNVHAAEALRRHQELERYQTERTSLLLRAGDAPGPGIHLDLARLAAKHGAYRTAAAEYREALAQSPQDPAIARELAAVQRCAALR